VFGLRLAGIKDGRRALSSNKPLIASTCTWKSSHRLGEVFTTSIDWSPFVIMDSLMPPRDRDEDEEDEEDHEDEPPVVREPDED
jgi:hypothetical protein